MSGFSMADELRKQLGGLSESDTMLEIPVERIMSNPKNFYPRPDGAAMTALVESIEANGLLEPPTVVPVGNGLYRLISGHSRMSAIRRLGEQDQSRVTVTHRWDRVLCRVLDPMSEDAELAAVIEANRQRVKSPALLADEAARLEAAYIKRQEAGEQLPGGIRANVAKALQINATKVSNLKAIKAGLKVPGIVQRWERDELPEAAALVIAKMDIDQQYRLLDWIIDNDKSWSIRDVQMFDHIWTLCRHDCPETAGLCPNAERMVRDKLRGDEFKCAGCCDWCLYRDTCSTCCDHVRAQRPASDGGTPPPPEKVAQNPAVKDLRLDYRTQTPTFCERVRALREKTGLSKKDFAESIGEYPDTYSAWENASMAGSGSIPKLALCLGTTTDYLYGLTDDPAPAAAPKEQPEGQLVICGWMPKGTNPGAESGLCVGLMRLSPEHPPTPKVLWWDGALGAWKFNARGERVSLEPEGWLRLPPVPGEGVTP